MQLKTVFKLAEGFLNVVLGVFITLMFLFLFLNIVLRYAFNSGIPWAEEMSRFLFIWITFLGAIIAFKDNQHLGVSALIKRCPLKLKKILYLLSSAIVIYVLYLSLVGSWRMTFLGKHNFASTTGMSLAWMWGVGIITFSVMLLIAVHNLYKGMFVKGAIDELVELRGSEDELDSEQLSCAAGLNSNGEPGGKKQL